MALQWFTTSRMWVWLFGFSFRRRIDSKIRYRNILVVIMILLRDYIERRFVLKKPYKGKGVIKTSVAPGKELIILFHIKSQNLPQSVSLPNPKIYNLVWYSFYDPFMNKINWQIVQIKLNHQEVYIHFSTFYAKLEVHSNKTIVLK